MATTAVIVPYREAPGRRPLLQWVGRQWAVAAPHVDFILCTDDPHGTGPWRKARAVANGINATTADLLVVHDADVWCEETMAAVRAVDAGRAEWAIPHNLVYRLKPRPTRVVLDGGQLVYSPVERKPYTGWPGGGVVVLTRDAWETAPLDPRFEGWGQEDEAWALALLTLVGPPWRGDAPLVHLYHQPAYRRTSKFGSREGKRLFERYVTAARSRDEMAALIAEAAP
jgi:hypothetical protein